MLVLQCKRNDPLFLEIDLGGGKIIRACVNVVDIRKHSVKLGVTAPRSVSILRGQIQAAVSGKPVSELVQDVKASART